jgi:NADH-quinone oxidoreductase subunit N
VLRITKPGLINERSRAMTRTDLIVLLPFIILAAASIAVMLGTALRRSRGLTVFLTLAGISLALASLPAISPLLPRQATALLVIDRYALYFIGLILAASFSVTLFSYSYLRIRGGQGEEFSILLLIATLGAMVLAASSHFASLFLGIELLTVSLYAMTAYCRDCDRGLEAGIKYLILAAASSAFLLFGMALVYAETGSMDFAGIAAQAGTVHALPFYAGLGLLIVGFGFKLAVVPFHLWTPDVYEGAPAPVTAFIATVSKGAVFAVVLRLFSTAGIRGESQLFTIFTVIALVSMSLGNLLALFQDNVKRVLAYSSIAHVGYLLVALLASGPMAFAAAAFYLAAYFITTLGAFGVVSLLSERDRDADGMDDYRGLAWRRPWIAAVFSAMLFSLAGIPLTAGFVGKFFLVASGIGSSLWLLVAALVINSVIGLFYYLRIIIALYSSPGREIPAPPAVSPAGSAMLAVLTMLLVWLGVYPGPIIELITKVMQNLS